MNQTKIETEYFTAIYSILVEDGKADKNMEDSFISSHIQEGNEKYGACDEWRFCGIFGFGGKYRRKRNTIDCYSEDETPKLILAMDAINIKLAKVYKDFKAKGMEFSIRSWA